MHRLVVNLGKMRSGSMQQAFPVRINQEDGAVHLAACFSLDGENQLFKNFGKRNSRGHLAEHAFFAFD
jgi:hypothetical protein